MSATVDVRLDGSIDDAVARAMPRNAGIDALRGLSIVLVVLHHVALRIPLKETALADVLPKRALGALSYSGYEAVFVFFVISGFLIAMHALQRWGTLSRIDVRAFYVRRASRILPCLLLLIAVLAVLHLLGVDKYVIDRPGQSLAGATLSALGFYLNWYEGQTGWLPGGWDVLWSLSVEEVFYLAFPVVFLLVRDARVLVVVLVLLALSLPITRAALAGNEIWQEKAYLPGMAAIAAGILAAFAARRFAPGRAIAGICVLAGASGLLCVLLAGDVLWKALGNGYMLVLTGAAALLVVGLHARAAAAAGAPMRGLGWLRAFGRLSYEIYLTHMFVVFAIVALFTRSGGDLRSGAWWFVAALLLCWALGWLVARVYSVPVERALRARWLVEARGQASH